MLNRSAAALCFLLTASVVVAVSPFESRVLREDLATLREDGLLLRAEPEAARVLSPASVMLGLSERPTRGSNLVLELDAEATEEAAIEFQAIYNGKTPVLLTRRDLEAGSNTVRWAIPQSDAFTSATLSLRGGGEAVVRDARMVESESLSLPERIRATYPASLQLRSVANPAPAGSLEMRLYVPRDLKGAVYTQNFEFRMRAGAREWVQPVVPVLAGGRGEDLPCFSMSAAMESPLPEQLLVELWMGRDSEAALLATLEVDARPLTSPTLEIPWRSIESFSAIERNGELAVYTSSTSEATPGSPLRLPNPGALFRLHVGDGKNWWVEEELHLEGQSRDWLASTPLEFSIGRVGDRFLGFFTSVFMSGYEGMGVASADGSLRLFPSAKNPVWVPIVDDGEQPGLWRGNAFFNLNDSMMAVSLEMPPGKPVVPRALTSTLQTRWVDLGSLDLPGLRPDAIEVTSFTDEGSYYLLAGPHPQLFMAKDTPLRGWTEVSFDVPDGWQHRQLVQWQDRLWLFGIVEPNGRGVVTWMPIEKKEGGFEARPMEVLEPQDDGGASDVQ